VAESGKQCQPGVGGKRDSSDGRSPRKTGAGVRLSPPTVFFQNQVPTIEKPSAHLAAESRA